MMSSERRLEINRTIALQCRKTNAKVTESQVEEIRRLNSEGVSQAELGRRFGISKAQVHNIVHRKRWAI